MDCWIQIWDQRFRCEDWVWKVLPQIFILKKNLQCPSFRDYPGSVPNFLNTIKIYGIFPIKKIYIYMQHIQLPKRRSISASLKFISVNFGKHFLFYKENICKIYFKGQHFCKNIFYIFWHVWYINIFPCGLWPILAILAKILSRFYFC